MSQEVVLGPGPIPYTVVLRAPEGHEAEFTVVTWVLDEDGTGCGVVLLPNGKVARVDALERNGWEVLGVGVIRLREDPGIITP